MNECAICTVKTNFVHGLYFELSFHSIAWSRKIIHCRDFAQITLEQRLGKVRQVTTFAFAMFMKNIIQPPFDWSIDWLCLYHERELLTRMFLSPVEARRPSGSVWYFCLYFEHENFLYCKDKVKNTSQNSVIAFTKEEKRPPWNPVVWIIIRATLAEKPYIVECSMMVFIAYLWQRKNRHAGWGYYIGSWSNRMISVQSKTDHWRALTLGAYDW